MRTSVVNGAPSLSWMDHAHLQPQWQLQHPEVAAGYQQRHFALQPPQKQLQHARKKKKLVLQQRTSAARQKQRLMLHAASVDAREKQTQTPQSPPPSTPPSPPSPPPTPTTPTARPPPPQSPPLQLPQTPPQRSRLRRREAVAQAEAAAMLHRLVVDLGLQRTHAGYTLAADAALKQFAWYEVGPGQGRQMRKEKAKVRAKELSLGLRRIAAAAVELQAVGRGVISRRAMRQRREGAAGREQLQPLHHPPAAATAAATAAAGSAAGAGAAAAAGAGTDAETEVGAAADAGTGTGVLETAVPPGTAARMAAATPEDADGQIPYESRDALRGSRLVRYLAGPRV